MKTDVVNYVEFSDLEQFLISRIGQRGLNDFFYNARYFPLDNPLQGTNIVEALKERILSKCHIKAFEVFIWSFSDEGHKFWWDLSEDWIRWCEDNNIKGWAK